MKRPVFAAGIVLATVLACDTAPKKITAADEAVLKAQFDTTVASFSSGKFDGWLAIWAADGVLYPPNGKALPSSAAREEWAKAFPPVEAASFQNVRVGGEGNFAWGTSDYILKITGAPIDSGRQLVVFHKGADGKWKVSHGMFNSAIPLPAAAGSKAMTKAPAKSKAGTKTTTRKATTKKRPA